MHWFADFCLLQALGIAGAVTFVPEKSIGRYFFKFHALLALGVGALGIVVGRPLITGIPGSPMGLFAHVAAWGFLAVLILYAAVVAGSRSPLRADLLWMPVSTGLIYAACDGFHRGGGGWNGLLLAAHFVTSAAMLGSVLVAMILGHWYLQDAALSFDPLIALSKLFLGACAAKAAVSGLYFALGFGGIEPLLWEFDGIFIWTRLGAGILFASLLAWMALSCAKSRANQSATGILYVAVMFVVVGEVMSMYLTLGRKEPLPL